MSKPCLFSAPFSFLGDLKDEFNSLILTDFKEVWNRDELVGDDTLTAWIVNPGQRFVIDDEALGLFTNLSVIVTPSTGSNHIDREACKKRGIAVFSLLDDRPTLDSISASAEFTFLLLLNTLRRLDVAKVEVSERRWRAKEDMLRGFELNGKQVGLVGMGRIGQRLGRWCTAFDSQVAYYDPYVEESQYAEWELERIFLESDIVVVCCLLTDETKGMINEALLKKLKSGASFVNTSRGEVLNEGDLVEVLKKRTDLRVALDVLAGEVTNTHLSSPLIEMHNQGQIVIAPHIAGATFESQTKAAKGAFNLLRNHLNQSLNVGSITE